MDFIKAFTADGILSWVNNSDVTATSMFDVKIQQVTLLSSGAKSQVIVSDNDAVNCSN